jgi:hypothetical protein
LLSRWVSRARASGSLVRALLHFEVSRGRSASATLLPLRFGAAMRRAIALPISPGRASAWWRGAKNPPIGVGKNRLFGNMTYQGANGGAPCNNAAGVLCYAPRLRNRTYAWRLRRTALQRRQPHWGGRIQFARSGLRYCVGGAEPVGIPKCDVLSSRMNAYCSAPYLHVTFGGPAGAGAVRGTVASAALPAPDGSDWSDDDESFIGDGTGRDSDLLSASRDVSLEGEQDAALYWLKEKGTPLCGARLSDGPGPRGRVFLRPRASSCCHAGAERRTPIPQGPPPGARTPTLGGRGPARSQGP